TTFTIDRELAARFKQYAKDEGRLQAKLAENWIRTYLQQQHLNGNGNGSTPVQNGARRDDRRRNEDFDTVTVSIDKALLNELKIEAIRKGKRLYQIVEDCFRVHLQPDA